jgi:hypothetical protein
MYVTITIAFFNFCFDLFFNAGRFQRAFSFAFQLIGNAQRWETVKKRRKSDVTQNQTRISIRISIAWKRPALGERSKKREKLDDDRSLGEFGVNLNAKCFTRLGPGSFYGNAP